MKENRTVIFPQSVVVPRKDEEGLSCSKSATVGFSLGAGVRDGDSSRLLCFKCSQWTIGGALVAVGVAGFWAMVLFWILWTQPGWITQHDGLRESRSFPPGKWVLTQVGPMDSTTFRETVDGWSVLPNWETLAPPNAIGTHWGLRGTFRQLHGENGPALHLREEGGCFFSTRLAENGALLIIERHGNEGSVTLGKQRLAEPIKRGAAYTLEFFAIRQRLVARVNCTVLEVGILESSRRGRASIADIGHEGYRDVMHVNLDGVAHEEALLLARVAPEATAVSPKLKMPEGKLATPVAAVSGHTLADFPAGQWRTVPYDPGSMPFLERIDNGWMTSPGAVSILPFKVKGHQWGIRVTFRHLHRAQVPELLLRASHESNFNAYLEDDGRTLVIQHFDRRATPQYRTLNEIALPKPVEPGRAYTLEFFAIGQVLIARCRDVMVEVDSAIPPQEGLASIYGIHFDHFRDVELINLDGMSEAAALEIARRR